MVDRIRFHLDENVTLAVGLRRHGIDVTTTQEAGLLGQADEMQLKFVRETRRVIFTQDQDFLIIASQSTNHAGITFCRKGKKGIGEIIEALVLIYEVLIPDDLVGKVEFL